jgi:hypothetical protein
MLAQYLKPYFLARSRNTTVKNLSEIEKNCSVFKDVILARSRSMMVTSMGDDFLQPYFLVKGRSIEKKRTWLNWRIFF